LDKENIKEHLLSFYSNFKQSITDFKAKVEDIEVQEEEEESEPVDPP